jgi:hypothetical protein
VPLHLLTHHPPTVIANQNSTIDNYNTRYTPQGRIKAGKRGTYKKDIHVYMFLRFVVLFVFIIAVDLIF